MRASRFFLFIVITAAIFAVSCNPDDMTNLKPGMFGTVTNAVSGSLVPDATITLQGKTTTSNGAGVYSIGNLTKGTARVRVTHAGYRPLERDVTVTSSVANLEDFRLTPIP